LAIFVVALLKLAIVALHRQNQFRYRNNHLCETISGDGVLSEVVIEIGGGQEVVSVITTSSVTRLGLKVGESITAIIKSTEVLLAR
jgi:molybdopterin-binding protein